MSDRSTNRESGFSLLEMTIAMALGTLVLGAAVQLYSQGVGATWTVSQRAELQQDFRATSNMLTKDLSLAGEGLGNGTQIPLPSAVTPVYGCDQTKCYLGSLNTSAGKYPLQPLPPLTGTTPYLYGLIPGYQLGPTLTSNPNATDVVTVAYADNAFYLNCYQATVTAAGQVTFAPSTIPVNGVVPAFPPAGCLPNGVTAPQAVNDSLLGLTPGDLVYFPAWNVVGEVTGAIATGTVTVNGTTYPSYIVPFANSDPLHMNQTAAGATAGLNGAALNSADLQATSGYCPCRLLVITYYIDNTVSPPRLMRQISGHSPMPVTDGVAYMKFSYDLFNDGTNTPAVGCQNPGASGDVCVAGTSTGLTPTDITKINILHMAMNSALKGARGGYQGLDLETSVSARDLTYSNTFPIPSNSN